MKTATLNINMRISFQYDETRNSTDDAKEYALDLAINPNYSSAEHGVHLIDHEISDVDFDNNKYSLPFLDEARIAMKELTIWKQ